MKIEKKYVSSIPCSILYKAWTSEEMAIDPVIRIDCNLKVDGHFHLFTENSKMLGKFLEVKENEKLKYTWIWEGSEEQTIVTAVFIQNDQNSILQLEHSGFSNEKSKEGHSYGWDAYFEKLVIKIENEWTY